MPSSSCYFSLFKSCHRVYPPIPCLPTSPQHLLIDLQAVPNQGSHWVLCCQFQEAPSHFIWFRFSEAFNKVKCSLLFETFTPLGLQDLILCLLPGGLLSPEDLVLGLFFSPLCWTPRLFIQPVALKSFIITMLMTSTFRSPVPISQSSISIAYFAFP